MIYLDFETRSAADLRSNGLERYVTDPSTDVLFFWYSTDGETIRYWDCRSPRPNELLTMVKYGMTVVAHNAQFEREIWNRVLAPRMGWPIIWLEQINCTMIRSHVLGLPSGLDSVCKLFGLGGKYEEGRILMNRFCVSGDDRISITDYLNCVSNTPDFMKFQQYGRTDVELLIALAKTLPELSPAVRQAWLDIYRVNQAGVPIDVEGCRKAVEVLTSAKLSLKAALTELTEGAITSPSQNARMVDWLRSRGYVTCSVDKRSVALVLRDAKKRGDKKALEVLKHFKAGSKTSTAKYATIVKWSDADSTVKWSLVFHKAITGRMAGQGPQFQNLPRLDYEKDGVLVNTVIQVVHNNQSPSHASRVLSLLVGPPHQVLSTSIRAFIKHPTKSLMGGDYKNIEGRANAWLAGLDWKVKAFEEFDAGTGPDLYNLTFSTSFGVPLEDVTKANRQIGKVQELASGYQGGIGAYMKMLATYNIDLDALVKQVSEVTGKEYWESKRILYKPNCNLGFSFGLDEDTWTALKITVDRWREKNDKIVEAWYEVQEAAVAAIKAPNVPIACLKGRIYYCFSPPFLYCRLPSGRMLAYLWPKLQVTEREVVKRDGEVTTVVTESVAFSGLAPNKKDMRCEYLYGGLQIENIIQAICADLLNDCVSRCLRLGIDVRLTVHDEILAVENGDYQTFQNAMSRQPDWSLGLPVAASTWIGDRYVK